VPLGIVLDVSPEEVPQGEVDSIHLAVGFIVIGAA
jgi:hypothetical protein